MSKTITKLMLNGEEYYIKEYEEGGISTPWIYHNPDLWLISLSWDWNTRITIMDKNLWATTVYNDWDTLSDDNCGYFYQWGNNYGFPHSWTVTTSSTQVDASGYGPWNYYSSSIFITWGYDRSSVQNDDLWWWVTWTNEAMQWPAPTDFHISSNTERQAICDILVTTFWLADNATTMWTYLKMPMAGYRNRSSSNVIDAGFYGYYWSSTDYDYNYAYYLYFDSSSLDSLDGNYRSNGLPVRCFQNTPTVPTASWTVLYQPS